MLEGATFKALSVEAKPTKRNPGPPFTTSTLQQAASSGLGFSATRTMQVAQRLYEGMEIGGETTGLITYMRTDGVQMAPEAIDAARDAIAKEFGPKYLPEKPRQYTAKAKNAQEAHEAIRPTDFMRTPASVRQYLDSDQMRLYELIWKRAIASQMQPAEIERTTVEIEAVNGARTAELRAVGSVVTFRRLHRRLHRPEGRRRGRRGKPSSARNPRRRAPCPPGDQRHPAHHRAAAALFRGDADQEAGRARHRSPVDLHRDPEDARRPRLCHHRQAPAGAPRPRAGSLSAFLESFFERYVEYDFTASLEEKLDEISDGKLAWKDVLRDFWKDFSGAVADIKELRVTDVLDALNEELAPLVFPTREDGSNPRICPKCGSGNLSLKLGKFGAFVGCSNYPECSFTRQLGDAANPNGENGGGEDGTKVLGKDPYTAEEITLRSGRFGPYVQRGDGKEAKRSSLPKGWTPESIDHEKALALLALPRDIGKHPETAKMISAGLGRYGPFVLHDGTYANLDSIEDVFSIGLNRAVTVIAEKQSKGKGGRNGGTAAALKELGDHPDGGGKIVVRDGKYGPYVNFGKVNATLPKGKDPAIGDRRGSAGTDCRDAKPARLAARQACPARQQPAKAPASEEHAAKKPAAKKKGRTAWRAGSPVGATAIHAPPIPGPRSRTTTGPRATKSCATSPKIPIVPESATSPRRSRCAVTIASG